MIFDVTYQKNQMFKKILFAFIVLTLIILCSFKRVVCTYNYNTVAHGIDFKNTNSTNGKWALNMLNIRGIRRAVDDNLNTIVFDKFMIWTKGKVVKKENFKDNQGKQYPFEISENPTKEDLINFKKTTNYNYLINIFLLEDTQKSKNREIKVVINIYDLGSQKMMLSQEVIGFLDKENGTDIGGDFKVNVIPDMMYKILTKGLKRIEKKSIY